jgi:hypothetical protein
MRGWKLESVIDDLRFAIPRLVFYYIISFFNPHIDMVHAHKSSLIYIVQDSQLLPFEVMPLEVILFEPMSRQYHLIEYRNSDVTYKIMWSYQLSPSIPGDL